MIGIRLMIILVFGISFDVYNKGMLTV